MDLHVIKSYIMIKVERLIFNSAEVYWIHLYVIKLVRLLVFFGYSQFPITIKTDCREVFLIVLSLIVLINANNRRKNKDFLHILRQSFRVQQRHINHYCSLYHYQQIVKTSSLHFYYVSIHVYIITFQVQYIHHLCSSILRLRFSSLAPITSSTFKRNYQE